MIATNRRTFLLAAAGSGLAATLDQPVRSAVFHGVHQAGILTPAPPHAVHVAFDVIATDRAGRTDLLRTITERPAS